MRPKLIGHLSGLLLMDLKENFNGSPPYDTPHPQPTFSKQIIPLTLIGFGALFVLAGSVWLVVNWLVIGQGNLTVPATLANLPLSAQITGQAALADIERLHGTTIPMVDGAIANYGDGQAVLWISSTWLPFMAARQVAAMANRIAGGGSPFTPIGTDEIEGVTVYAVTGMGQNHYYFQLDRRVVWLAVSPHIAEQSLKQLVRNLQ